MEFSSITETLKTIRSKKISIEELNQIFITRIKNNKKPSVGFEDGRNALLIANAAYESNRQKKTIQVNYE